MQLFLCNANTNTNSQDRGEIVIYVPIALLAPVIINGKTSCQETFF